MSAQNDQLKAVESLLCDVGNNGFDYVFRRTSDYTEIEDGEFHKLREAYVDAAVELDFYINILAINHGIDRDDYVRDTPNSGMYDKYRHLFIDLWVLVKELDVEFPVWTGDEDDDDTVDVPSTVIENIRRALKKIREVERHE